MGEEEEEELRAEEELEKGWGKRGKMRQRRWQEEGEKEVVEVGRKKVREQVDQEEED